MAEWKRCYGCMTQEEDWDGQGFCPCCGFRREDYQAGINVLPLGTELLRGRYVVGKKISRGGFGITYIGWDTELEHKVAIKEYYPSELVDRDTTLSNNVTIQDKQELVERERKNFLEEAKILYSLSSCRGIVHIENIIGDENGTSYIIMELLEGLTLKEYRDRKPNNQMSLKETLQIMEPVIKSLQEVHKKGLIHRDISPDNIMLCNNQEVKLLDFGAARQQDRTQFTTIMKVEFAPPEQRFRKPGEDERSRSLKQQGPWTDVYALCATIYYLVAGKAAETSQARICHMLEVGEDMLVPLSHWNDEVDEYMDNVIQKGMAMKIGNRYQSMEELYRALYEPKIEKKIETAGGYRSTEKVSEGIQEEIRGTEFVRQPEITGKPVAPVGRQKEQKSFERQKRKKSYVIPVLVIACTIGIGLLVGGVFFMRNSADKPAADRNDAKAPVETLAMETKAPAVYQMVSVVGLGKKEAAGKLEKIASDGLKISYKEKNSSQTARGKVISQSVDPGTEWKEGEKIQVVLVLSRGEKLYKVPKVIRDSEGKARKKLKKAKMKVSVVREYSSSYEKGRVIRQSVSAGKKVKKAKAVTIAISKGAKPVVTQSSTASENNVTQRSSTGYQSSNSRSKSSSTTGKSSGSSNTQKKKNTSKKAIPPM
ncbi:MAG: PASTA domain-containing protein [Lachnospiraceae bacterium]|nr:PASTA domain-containing protein [Lachnospiraceae bacterium]